MSTRKKYLCKGCPGTVIPRPIPYLGDWSGEGINVTIRSLKRSDDAQLRQTGERVCRLIQGERCNGPQEQEAVGFDSEGPYRIPGKVDIVCGRQRDEILEIASIVSGTS